MLLYREPSPITHDPNALYSVAADIRHEAAPESHDEYAMLDAHTKNKPKTAPKAQVSSSMLNIVCFVTPTAHMIKSNFLVEIVSDNDIPLMVPPPPPPRSPVSCRSRSGLRGTSTPCLCPRGAALRGSRTAPLPLRSSWLRCTPRPT